MTDRREDADVSRSLDPEVARVLVDNHRQFLRFLERRVGGRDVAEDILQDAFARGLDKLESLRDDEAVVAWFYRTLRNAIIDHVRRGQSRGRALAQLAQEMEHAEAPVTAVREEVCRCVLRLAETLKPEYADALQRIEVEGASLADFAEARGISKNNAAVRVFRAREALRKQLAVSCGTCAEHGCISCTCDAPEEDRRRPSGTRDQPKDRGREAPMPKTKETMLLLVEGMTCSACARHVESALRELDGPDGIGEIEVKVDEGRVRVEHDPARVPVERLLAAITDAGYEGRPAKGLG